MAQVLFAHTATGREPETLEAHANNVACHAQKLAQRFDAGGLGHAAGLLHDLGKSKPAFQAYLVGKGKSEPHSAEGALFAEQHYKLKCPRPFEAPIGRLLAFAIAGHHAGLANGNAAGGGTRPLNDRLAQAEAITPWFDLARLPAQTRPPSPLVASRSRGIPDPFGWAFFTRMLFSALVDADRLETERWANEGNPDAVERRWLGTLDQLQQALNNYISEKFEKQVDRSELSVLRAEVLADCRTAALQKTGLFSLTVPTGGGKTISSLAFALDHAIKHKLDRVIYVIPLTSIVEQTAAVFREALGDDDAILEHHSAIDDEKLVSHAERDEDFGLKRLRLVAQNWDRPIIVTTAVQFFESLFANKPGRCRKLHNIARSVVILDEGQTLPVKLLRPCLAAINELVRGYNTSIVLCTATQPAVTKAAGLEAPEALEGVCEIIPPERRLFDRLKRVRAETTETLTDAELIEALTDVDQGLVIVNNRRHARELFVALQKAGVGGARHLTTAMTAAHRQNVLGEIRDNLASGQPVRLIATSLIEAGVDISFRAVWRAWAGLDQIVQAAGRCNRNGELGPEGGELTIFAPEAIEGRGTPRELKPNIEAAQRVLRDGIDPLSPEAMEAYFRELLWTKQDGGHWRLLDNVKVGEQPFHGIITAIDATKHGLNFPFADISQAFRIIEETMVPVIIPASIHPAAGAPDEALLASILHLPSTGGIARKLQRHIVQIPRRARDRLISAGSAYAIAPDKLGEQFVVLSNKDIYDGHAGLDWNDAGFRSAASLIW